MKPNLDGLILTQSAQNSLKASGSSRARTRMDTDQEKEHRVDWAVKLQSLFKKKKLWKLCYSLKWTLTFPQPRGSLDSMRKTDEWAVSSVRK